VPAQAEALRGNWGRLTERGTRTPGSPLAKGWPKRFDGDFAAYSRFETSLSLKTNLLESDALFVTKWANATIDRHSLSLNFAAKLEWPKE
jgi:hypothetical protein